VCGSHSRHHDLPTIGNPPALIAAQPIELLAAVVSSRVRGAYIDACDEVRFLCPKCARTDYTGGTAEILDAYRWRCWKCHHHGTRYLLERLTLEDADLLEYLYRLIEERRRAVG
jgi:predicted RNA-binding Zn-ribbon protein involved in translation (DUF1610 family)